jgi:hypothetical protein
LFAGKTVWRIRHFWGFGRAAKAVTAALAVALVLVLGTFAVSPSLHQRVHEESNRPDGICLVCAFANGQLTGASIIAVAAVACVFLVDVVFLADTTLISYLDFYFLPNRGPPYSKRFPLFN